MITLAMHGGVFQVPEKCQDCGAVPTVIAMEKELAPRPYERPCCFCGGRIRVVSGTWKHFHRPDGKRGNTWSMDTAFEEEPHWDWLTSTPYGTFDIRGHEVCARAAMRHADYTGKREKPKEIPQGGIPTETVLEKCHQCGQTPTAEDMAVVAARAYGSGPGPCVYCGKPIRLEKLEVTHFWWDGQHCEKWQWGGMRFEKYVMWSTYLPGTGGLYFNGHLDCTLRAMPYHVFREDQPGCNCK
jgi:hypothetical protein